MHIAVLGMGRMGVALAGRLLADGHRITIWNRTKGRAAQLESRGASEAATVSEAVSGVDAVITILSDDAAVRAVALDDLRAAITPDTPYIDSSTISPALSAKLAETFGRRFVSMPIAGAPAAVNAGTATLLAGGEGATLDALSPLLRSLSDSVRRYESPALALAAKVTGNYLLLAGVATLAEAFALGRAGGLDDTQLRELLDGAPVVSDAMRGRFQAILTADTDGWWTTVLGAKDAGLAVDTAAAVGVELPLAERVRERFLAAADHDPHADISAVAALYQNRTTPPA
ncbi:MAG: NAD(P)-dependent oxidoreductase [Nocardia sp.]|nr:NAD(P)-dependent oxidoreductase [Nocardia sp.]